MVFFTTTTSLLRGTLFVLILPLIVNIFLKSTREVTKFSVEYNNDEPNQNHTTETFSSVNDDAGKKRFFEAISRVHVLQYGDPKYQTDLRHQRKIHRTEEWARLAGYTYTMLDYSATMPDVCGYTRKVAAIRDTLQNITLDVDWLLFLDLDATPFQANVFALEEYLLQHERINATKCHFIAKSAAIEINTGVLLIKSTQTMRDIAQQWLEYQTEHPVCKGGADQVALATVLLQREHAHQQRTNSNYNISVYGNDPFCASGSPGSRTFCWKRVMDVLRPRTRAQGRNPSKGGGDRICELGCQDNYQCHYCQPSGTFGCNESAAIFFHNQHKKNDASVLFPQFQVPSQTHE